MADEALDRATRTICPSRDLCDADACCASCRLADSEITSGPLASDIVRAAIVAFQAGAPVVEVEPIYHWNYSRTSPQIAPGSQIKPLQFHDGELGPGTYVLTKRVEDTK